MEGKHICVECPIAFDVDDARNLFDMADMRNVVLHVQVGQLLRNRQDPRTTSSVLSGVQHVELLDAGWQKLKALVASKGRLKRAEFGFVAPPLSPADGFPTFSGIQRLHR
jgi:hypothetical protein